MRRVNQKLPQVSVQNYILQILGVVAPRPTPTQHYKISMPKGYLVQYKLFRSIYLVKYLDQKLLGQIQYHN